MGGNSRCPIIFSDGNSQVKLARGQALKVRAACRSCYTSAGLLSRISRQPGRVAGRDDPLRVFRARPTQAEPSEVFRHDKTQTKTASEEQDRGSLRRRRDQDGYRCAQGSSGRCVPCLFVRRCQVDAFFGGIRSDHRLDRQRASLPSHARRPGASPAVGLAPRAPVDRGLTSGPCHPAASMGDVVLAVTHTLEKRLRLGSDVRLDVADEHVDAFAGLLASGLISKTTPTAPRAWLYPSPNSRSPR